MAAAQLDRAQELAPIVERVHGPNHPEMTRIREITDAVSAVEDSERMEALFAELRQLTDSYTPPADTCETVEALYRALASVDQDRKQSSIA